MGADAGYDTLLARVSERLAALREPVFVTDAGEDDLVARFVDALPEDLEQEYTCATCARFIAEFGVLVTIDERGETTPLVWDPAPDYGELSAGVEALAERVAAAEVRGVYLNHRAQWGQPERGGFRHLAGTVDACVVHTHPVDSAHQRSAELTKDFTTLRRALQEYSSDHIDVALGLLRGEQLFRGDKILGVGEWLAKLDQRLREAAGKKYRTTQHKARARVRDNLLWRAVAEAPPGFCRVRSTMIGTLLDDIAAGKSFAAVERAFRQKMDPLAYQRPQAQPSAGNLRDAEALIAKIGSASAFDRRFARVEDLEALWRPEAAPTPASTTAASSGGDGPPLFAGIEPKGARAKAPAAADAPAQKVTWVKLRRTALADAARVELWVPATAHFYAFVTAVDPEAAPIIQWDREDRRNPVTWYTHHNPPAAPDWSLSIGWHDLAAISLFPHMWADENAFAHQTPGVLLVIAGCRPKSHGSGLFPEFMKSEYRPIRASIAALMKGRDLAGRDEASACGVAIRPNSPPPQPLRLRVHPRGRGIVRDYAIDRWD